MSKVIFEEDVSMPYNRWVQGIGVREHGTNKINLYDLFNKFDRQFPGDYVEKTYTPPTLTAVSEILGYISNGNSNLKDKLQQTYKLPFCRENADKKETVKSIYKKTLEIDKILQTIAKDLNSLVEQTNKDVKINNDESK